MSSLARREEGREGGREGYVPRVLLPHVFERGDVQSKGVVAREFLDDDFGLDGEGGGEFRELGRKGGREGGREGGRGLKG